MSGGLGRQRPKCWRESWKLCFNNRETPGQQFRQGLIVFALTSQKSSLSLFNDTTKKETGDAGRLGVWRRVPCLTDVCVCEQPANRKLLTPRLVLLMFWPLMKDISAVCRSPGTLSHDFGRTNRRFSSIKGRSIGNRGPQCWPEQFCPKKSCHKTICWAAVALVPRKEGTWADKRRNVWLGEDSYWPLWLNETRVTFWKSLTKQMVKEKNARRLVKKVPQNTMFSTLSTKVGPKARELRDKPRNRGKTPHFIFFQKDRPFLEFSGEKLFTKPFFPFFLVSDHFAHFWPLPANLSTISTILDHSRPSTIDHIDHSRPFSTIDHGSKGTRNHKFWKNR